MIVLFNNLSRIKKVYFGIQNKSLQKGNQVTYGLVLFKNNRLRRNKKNKNS